MTLFLHYSIFSRTPKCPGSYPRLGITATRDCFMSSCDLPIISISSEKSLMTFSSAKLKCRQTEESPYLDQYMTFEGSDKSACTLTNTGCLPLLLSSISPAHQKFHAILW
jgi:hypothetical protein